MSKKENNEIIREYEKVKFLSDEEGENFKASLEIFEKALKIANPKKREKTLKEAIEKSAYNVEAQLALIAEDQKLSLREKRNELENLEELTHSYPIEGNDFINPFFKTVIDYTTQFFLENNLYVSRNPYGAIRVNLEKGSIEKLDAGVINSVKIDLLRDDKANFDEFYEKLNGEMKNNEFILLSKVIFAIKENNTYDAVTTMESLKYKNPDIEVALDLISGKKINKAVDENSTSFIMTTFVFEQLGEIIASSEYVQNNLAWLNEDVRTDDPELKRTIEKQSITLEDMKNDPIFSGIRTCTLKRLQEEQLVDEASFAEFSKKDFAYIEGIGRTTIKKLVENGVKFKEEE